MTILASAFVGHVAAFVDYFAWVYAIAIILYVLTSMIFAAGLRIPYNRWSDAILTFLRDVSEPCLRLFRRILPSFGALDLSPIVAIIVVRLAGSLAARAIGG
ncbi:MAG: YggT family protein [Solirubrobacteraceae bacterium]